MHTKYSRSDDLLYLTTQNDASLLRRAPNTDFPDVIKFRVAMRTLWEKAIRDYDPDGAKS